MLLVVVGEVERKVHLVVIIIKLIAEVEDKTHQNNAQPVADQKDNPE